ncbi:quercetin dioxygenase-like cupin family protein [Mycobacterium sp. OAS707]|uniref:dimethylsulfonioproprionate lyase family protein n=1 Tax=Mycobacterium sp. OAS707 TaxID=2663822 RepID=UPI00178941E3|nr:dimethylsulfonioproprionate lyase family protein [Mycobacterium sp. OAS707]MBE1551724.1 quercetin dioxygenase-like cupin family protein [Mycobacterium sp. OAS707]
MTNLAAAQRSTQLRDGRTAAILRPAEITPRQRGGGARTIPMVSQRVGAKDFLNGITIFGPGTAIPEHFHNCDESVLVLHGSAIAHIDGETFSVSTGDTSFIPAGIPHFFQNASDSEELHIFWTYASVDADRTVVATGVTTRIDEEHGTNIG